MLNGTSGIINLETKFAINFHKPPRYSDYIILEFPDGILAMISRYLDLTVSTLRYPQEHKTNDR